MTHKILRTIGETKDLKEFIKGELFDLHCDINSLNGVRPPNPVPYTALEERFPPYGLRAVLAELDTMFDAAKELRTINIDAVKMWKKAVDQLVIKYDIAAVAPPAPRPVQAQAQVPVKSLEAQPIVQEKKVDVEAEKARMLADVHSHVESEKTRMLAEACSHVESEKTRMLADVHSHVESEKARMLADVHSHVESEKARMLADVHSHVESEKARMLAELHASVESEKANMHLTSEIETYSASMSGLSIIDDVEEEWLGH
jgi:F0F1-type ATP synthase membrane subunit b/b'